MDARPKTTAAASRRRRRGVVPAPQKWCNNAGCNNLMSGMDGHHRCVFCLGFDHALKGLKEPGYCSVCIRMDHRTLTHRLVRVRDAMGLARYNNELDEEYPARRGPAPRPRQDPWPSHILEGGLGSSHQAAGASRAPGPCYDMGLVRPSSREASASSSSSRPPPARPSAAAASSEAPADCDIPWPEHGRRDWDDDYMDEEDPLDVLQPFQDPGQFRVVDEAMADSDNGGDEYGEDREDLPVQRDEDIEPPLQAAREQDPEDEAPVAVAHGGVNPPPANNEVLRDDSELITVYRIAAIRCQRTWPEEIQPEVPDEEAWPMLEDMGPRPAPAVRLPFAQGFRATITQTWTAPFPETAVRRPTFSLETEEPETAGLGPLPSVDRAMAGYLLNPSSPQPVPADKEPSFATRKEKDASAANKRLFLYQVAAGRTLNAAALLQGSTTSLLREAGDHPTPQQMAELRRLHNESVALTRTVTEMVGRTMTASILQERARWLDIYPVTGDVRDMLMKRPISAEKEGLFPGAMAELTARGEARRREEEALRACAPRPPRAPAGPPPPPRTRGRGRPAWRGRADRGHDSSRAPSSSRTSSASRERQRASKKEDTRRPTSPRPPAPKQGAGRGQKPKGGK